SDAAALQKARLVFWTGPGLEAFLVRPLETLAGDATVVELSQAEGIRLLPFRAGGPFEAHEHGHDHHDGDDHDHDDDHGHDHADDAHAHEGHGTRDMHVWLDPANAKAMVAAIGASLSQADPANAARYAANVAAMRQRIDGLNGELAQTLAAAKGKPFIVFHDAYQYFEQAFGLTAAGSITVSPEVMPGADRLTTIRARVR